jgi:hypothetical protein
MILAIFLIMPFIARSQNEGIKASSNPKSTEQSPMHPRATQEMAQMQGKSTTGGAPNPSINSYKTEGIYLEPGWAPGRIMLSDMSIVDNILLRYDIYHQQIQFIRDEDTLAFSKPEEVKCFMLGDNKFIYTDYQENGIVGKSYFELLSDGDCKLLLHRSVKYHLVSDSQSDKPDDQYVRECQYYLSKNGEVAKPIRACRKGVLCAFNDKEEQVKTFIDDNDMKMNTCDQLKEVVAYYNSLQ